jgi:hypothetical protein
LICTIAEGRPGSLMVSDEIVTPAQSLLGQRSSLDEVNLRLLDVLAQDPRLTAADVARRIGMSAPAVRERMTRLEVDPAVLDRFLMFGQTISSFVVSTPVPPRQPRPAGQ